MKERRPLRLLTAAVAAIATACLGWAAAGFLEGDHGWLAACAAVLVFYGAVTYGLFAGRLWAPALAQGASLFGAAAFAQSAWALESYTLPVIVGGFSIHLLLGALALLLDDGLSKRQRWSLRFAGAALAPAAFFALAPEQTGGTMVAVLVGAALAWLGALGVARGRTWGVLAALLGAPVLAIAVWYAPELGYFDAQHFMVDQPLLPLMLDVLGLAAAAGALLSVAPFLGPIARFLLRGKAA
jgi:hypothetical protein